MALYGALAALNPGEKMIHGTILPVAATAVITLALEGIRIAGVSMNGDPVITHTSASVTWTGADLLLKFWKPTDTTLTTPVAATTPWLTVAWWAIGQAPR